MVTCCIPCCLSDQKTNFNKRNIQLFRFPVEKNLEKTKIRKGKEGIYHYKKNEISNKQRIAWFKACNRCLNSESLAPDTSENLRICIHYFHPSILTKYNNNKYSLKLGAALTMYLTQSSILHEKFIEVSSLLRFVVSQEGIEFVELHKAKKLLSKKKSLSHANKIAS